MDFRSGIGLNGLHLPHLPPPNHPIAPPTGLFYHHHQLSSASGSPKNPNIGSNAQLHLRNGSPRTSATIQPSLLPKREDALENGASSFAAALRNLAKNVAMSSLSSSSTSPSSTPSNISNSPPGQDHRKSASEEIKIQSPAQSALLDVRKGFDRQDKSSSSSEKVPSHCAPSIPSKQKSLHAIDASSRESGFQPYRALPESTAATGICSNASSSKFIPPSYTPYPVFPNSHLPYPFSYEASTLYRTQYESYMASMGGNPSLLPISGNFSPSSSSTYTEKDKPESLPKNSSKKKKIEEIHYPDEQQQPPPKKKCLFVRPFEDDYTSLKKKTKSASGSPSLLLNEPVLNATAYHPPSSSNSILTESPPTKQEEEQTLEPKKGCTAETLNIGLHEKPEPKIEPQNILTEQKPPIRLINNRQQDASNPHKKSKENDCNILKDGPIIKITLKPKRKSVKASLPSPSQKEELVGSTSIFDDTISSPPSLGLPSTPPHLNKIPESNTKKMFLNILELTRVPDCKKQEMENIWNVALDERIYRNALATTTTQYLLQCRQLSPARGTKPPLGFLSPSLTSKASTKAPSRKTHFITTLHNGLSLPKLPIDLGSLVPVSKSLLCEVKSNESPPPILVTTPSPIPASSNSAILNVGSNTFELKSVTPAWTGIESVIQGYKKFHEERDNEIQKLNSQLKQLMQDETKNRSNFDKLTSQMATTVRYKNILKSKKVKITESITELVDLLKQLKKL